MANFGETLERCMEELGVTQTFVADSIGCARAMIYSVLNNKKRLGEDTFLKLVSNLPFSDEQTEALRKEYYRDKYPNGTIDRIYSLRKHLLNKNEQSTTVLPQAEIPTGVVPEISTDINGEANILKTIVGMLCNSGCKRVITNYPFNATKLDNIIFTLLSQNSGEIDFKHLVRYEESNKTPLNIDNIFKSIRYIKIAQIPLHYYSQSPTLDSSVLFPFFFYTDKGVLLFDLTRHSGLFLCESALLKATEANIMHLVKKCIPTGKINKSVLDLKNEISRISQRKHYCIFGNTPCLGPVVTDEIISAVPRDDMPNRDALIQVAINHYSMFLEAQPVRYFDISGIQNFARNGLVHEIPQAWIQPLSYSHRKQLLQRLKELALNRPALLKLIDKTAIDVADPYFVFEAFGNNLFIGGSISNDGREYYGEYSLTVENKNITADFKYFIDFIDCNHLFFSDEYTVNFFNDLILECDMLEAKEHDADKSPPTETNFPFG